MEEGIIKSFVPHICPHCEKDFLVEIKMTAPEITTILRSDDVNNAKQEVISRIDASEMDVAEKQKAVEWLSNPDILFGPNDVEEVINGIIK